MKERSGELKLNQRRRGKEQRQVKRGRKRGSLQDGGRGEKKGREIERYGREGEKW